MADAEEEYEKARAKRAEAGQGASTTQGIYQREVLPGQVQAVEEQLGAVRRAGAAEEAASTARARDISRSLGGSAPGGFEETLRGTITQEAGAALGYESALRGAKAQKELQDPSRLAPITSAREHELVKLQDEIQTQTTQGEAISTASTLIGGTLSAAGGVAATVGASAATAAAAAGTTVSAASATASAFGPIGLIVGAIIAIVGGLIGLGVATEAGKDAGQKAEAITNQYDPTKVKQVGFQSALTRAQDTRGFLGSQFTGGATSGAGIPNYGGLAPRAEEAAPWTQFTGV